MATQNTRSESFSLLQLGSKSFSRRLASSQAPPMPTVHIRPYQWIFSGPRAMATGSICG